MANIESSCETCAMRDGRQTCAESRQRLSPRQDPLGVCEFWRMGLSAAAVFGEERIVSPFTTTSGNPPGAPSGPRRCGPIPQRLEPPEGGQLAGQFENGPPLPPGPSYRELEARVSALEAENKRLREIVYDLALGLDDIGCKSWNDCYDQCREVAEELVNDSLAAIREVAAAQDEGRNA